MQHDFDTAETQLPFWLPSLIPGGAKKDSQSLLTLIFTLHNKPSDWRSYRMDVSHDLMQKSLFCMYSDQGSRIRSAELKQGRINN